MDKDVAIKVDNLSKTFKLPHEKHGSLKNVFVNIFRGRTTYEKQKVLDNISFEIKKGEFFGIVGRNGSGKSTLLKLLAGVYSPNSGAIHVNGKVTPFIELGVGFNPELTGRENVFLNGSLLGFSREKMDRMYNEIVDFAELEKFMDQKLKNYSSGMQVRLAFSIAIRAEGDILLLDEVLAVGDAAFQRKCYNYFEELRSEKRTVIFVTHDMDAVKRFCTRALFINNGEITNVGDAETVSKKYLEEVLKTKSERSISGKQRQELKELPESTLDSYYNPQLSMHWAEHKLLLENNKKYYREPAQQGQYKSAESDPRLVAFYLPQFYPIKENDETWGKGFTEWNNVTSAEPRFIGHQQPLLPADLGFYDLRLEDNIHEQIRLAKKHGLHGFCFYYYWFSGERLLEKPLDSLLKHKEWDFNFMICWANENWTKRWDGSDEEIIISQKYLDSDPLKFIKDVEDILLDPRYIKQNGKPLLAVYRASDLKKPRHYVKVWREYFKRQHKMDLEIVGVHNFDVSDPRKYGFDGGIEFAPFIDINTNKKDFEERRTTINGIDDHLLDQNLLGWVIDYRYFSKQQGVPELKWPTYKSICPSWDNDARRKGRGTLIVHGSNPDLYGSWLDRILEKEMKKTKSPLVFINAWNEWAEGTTMEPTSHQGHAILNRTTEVLATYSGDSNNQKTYPLYGIERKAKLAIIVHIYYPDEWSYLEKKIKNNLSDNQYDLFITITEKDKNKIAKIKKDNPGAFIKVVPNRGRDVLPFIVMASRLEKLGYKYFLKMHTKRSAHRDDGNIWFKELIDNLLPNKKNTKEILHALEADAKFIGPRGHYISMQNYIGSNKEKITKLLKKINNGSQQGAFNPDKMGFFAGDMFWCKVDYIKPLLDLNLIPEDFESEQGQIDGTLAHAIERVLTILPGARNGKIYQSSKTDLSEITEREPDIIKKYKYAP